MGAEDPAGEEEGLIVVAAQLLACEVHRAHIIEIGFGDGQRTPVVFVAEFFDAAEGEAWRIGACCRPRVVFWSLRNQGSSRKTRGANSSH
jgi:hypothetical protein